MQAGLKNAYESIKAFSETDFTEDLKKFDVPTLVMHGEDDQIVPVKDSARKSARLIKGAQEIYYPGAPHGLTATHPGPGQHATCSRSCAADQPDAAGAGGPGSPGDAVRDLFDLVFVFALTRIMALDRAAADPACHGARLLLLVFLWIAWGSYTWLGNQTPADVGVVRAGVPRRHGGVVRRRAGHAPWEAWSPGPGLDGPLLLALAYVLLRVVHLTLYHWAAGSVPGLRARIRFFASISALS